MKTVRFAKVVDECGKPEIYLVLSDPAKDKALQTAVRQHRVMTIYQEASGAKTDYGTVGFEPGRSRQYLVFPKALERFAEERVVGIKFELIDSTPTAMPIRKPEVKTKPETAAVRNQPVEAKDRKSPEKQIEKPAPGKLVQFSAPSPSEQPAARESLEDLKQRVREAMEILEQGKQVQAFQLLKKIVEG